MNRIQLVSIFLILLNCVSCTRENAEQNAYLGTYSCVQTCSHWIMSQPTTYDTSLVNIEVLPDSNSQNEVIVNGDTIQLDANGTYSINQGSSYGYTISFRNDSIFIM